MRIFVAEDEPRVREGIRAHIESTGRYTLTGEAADGEMALSAILELKPDILIADVRMPFMDGLSLARAVKRAMPRTGILIVSGHDEFGYAKESISIGVEDYLLKPISAKSLLEALDRIADRIEEERAARADINRGRFLERQEQLQLRDGFFDELFTGALDTASALERAAHYGIDLPARLYQVAEMELDYQEAAPDAALHVRALVEELLSARDDVLSCLRGRDRLVFIIKGEKEAELEESSYEIVISVRDELARTLNVHSVTGIGTPTERIAGIAKSYSDAHALIRRLPGPADGIILDCNDVGGGSDPYLVAALDEPIARRLRYAAAQDMETILDQLFSAHEEQSMNSFLFGYYRITELLVAAARILKEAGAEVGEIYPELNNPDSLLHAAGNAAQLRRIAKGILERLFENRGQDPDSVKYGGVIAKAKDYIYENFSKPALSLNTVAAYTGFSPNHFSTVFSQNTGETFISFLTRVRMEHARALLGETDLPSAEVAYRVGYNDSNYFRYLFKKHYGKSPRDYRG